MLLSMMLSLSMVTLLSLSVESLLLMIISALLLLKLLRRLFLFFLLLLLPPRFNEVSTILTLRKSLNFSKAETLLFISPVLGELTHPSISSGSLLNLFNPQHPLCTTPHGFIESTPKKFS
jgi:hypothetical protein